MIHWFQNLVNPYVAYEEEAVPPKRLWPFLLGYSRPFRQVFVVTTLASITIAAIELALIATMGWVVDILEGDPAGFWERHGSSLLLAAGFILLVWPALQALDVLLLNNTILTNFATLVRWRAHRHVLRQPVGWFERDFAGRIAGRVMQTPPAAGEAIFQIFDAITYSTAYAIGAVILVSGTDPRLTIPLLAWLALYCALIIWTVRRVGPASQAASDARSELTGRVVDSYTNIHSVKLFDHKEREIEWAKEAIESTRQTFAAEMRLYTIMEVALTLINGLLIVGVVGWAIALWMNGAATAGSIAAATALVLRLNAMTGWIMWAMTNFFQQLGVVAEGMETIARPLELVDAPDAPELQFTAGQIHIINLSHHYGRGKGGLSGINLTVSPGERIGLVGRSGAGKSTLVKLLLRFYDAESGKIMIDGQDISKVTQNSLRMNIGMVQQDGALLHRSVRDNIAYGRAGATEEEIRAAARKARADAFIDDLVDSDGRQGYDAHVGERGVKLSGGQRQRIVLARVIIKDAPILVLDEATSALDSEVEAQIQMTLKEMMRNKTVLAIAHRLSTIASMDRIIVLDAGQIIEDGTHPELIARRGLYADFWERQSGGFLATREAG